MHVKSSWPQPAKLLPKQSCCYSVSRGFGDASRLAHPTLGQAAQDVLRKSARTEGKESGDAGETHDDYFVWEMLVQVERK